MDAKGRRLRVHKLPLPAPVTITEEECEGLDLCEGEPTRTPGERLAASYVNFYIANRTVVMPAFDDPMDETAKEILQGLFPTRRVVAIPARDILIGGGEHPWHHAADPPRVSAGITNRMRSESI